MALNDVYELAIVNNFNGLTEMIVTQHYRVTPISLTDSAEDLVAGWQATVRESYLNLLSARMEISLIRCKKVLPTGPEQVETGDGSNGTLPESTGDISSFILAPIISWRTGFAGRSNRGRTYLVCPTENYIVDGKVNVGYQGFMEAFAQAGQVIETTLGVYQRTVWSPTLQTDRLVTSWINRENLGRQSRRAIGRGS